MRIGYATKFSTRVRKAERETLSVGQTVIIEGDSVPDAEATVVSIDEPDVTFELRKAHRG